ncbi:hypothetical protein NE237_002797 [Protea cynaroides]|uniref:Homeobox domain-containing protein n=1 Tax=Protea cynaroides TaxID=273540 RepID=A0A9Q0KFM8_9MAGN|nr:hypothetical protein NE237_002797 [Protea cynaroides]
MAPAASTRWCPTPEQLMILEELYRGGIRTPNSFQIQKITNNLSLYGKIEGKNVFYWFQNHKARDRQKLRRKLLIQQQQQQIESPPPSFVTAADFQQLPVVYSQAHSFLPQGRESSMMGCHGWKTMDSSSRAEMENQDTMYGQDWMMINGTPCCNRPPKTLQLFPITTKALKDECATPYHHFSCSTSTSTSNTTN